MTSDTNNINSNFFGPSINSQGTFLQSDCLYIQAAGSEGEESTKGIHLRWILKGPLEQHLPKGNHFQDIPEGFNKPNDFVYLSRAPYYPVLTTLDFTKSAPNATVDNQALWLYEVNGRTFYVYFRNTVKYQQLRSSINPLSDFWSFMYAYGNNIIEVECKEMLFFASTINTNGREISQGGVKTEILSVECNRLNLPKNVTFRKNITEFSEKIFAENGRSIRFAALNCIVTHIDFEFYDDFVDNSSWQSMDQYALTLDDDQVRKRLAPEQIHARWARYNDGEFVNAENYVTKWNGKLPDDRNRIKDAVEQYLKLSDDPANPLANEYHYYVGDDPNDPNNTPLEISNLSILQMASLDYHVARMLGLGILDTDNEIYEGQQYVYAANYVTIADLNDGQGVSEVNHLALSLPTALNDQRKSLQIDLKEPLPGIISADPSVAAVPSITDTDGYSHDGTARYLTLMIEEVLPDEPADSPFYFTSHEFSMADFTYPVYVGIEYRDEADNEWRIPELPFDPNYNNVRNDGHISEKETVPISLPDVGQPAYVHKETRTGRHVYGSYGVNWFSRAKSSETTWTVESEIKPTNTLLPPSSVNAFLIQKESPILLTSDNEQVLLSQIPQGSDKTLVKLTFEYDTNQDMKSYHKAINGQDISDFNPLPDNEEIFADNVEIFFRPEIPKQVFGMINTVSDLPGNPLVAVVTTKDLPLSSAGQIASPYIPSPEYQNYVGGIFKVGADDYIIHNIVSGSTATHPTFHILKKQISTAFGQNLTIPFDPANFTSPSMDESFMVVENMQNPSTWGNANPHPLKVQIGSAWTIHTEEVVISSGQSPDITENTYFRKFRGIVGNNVIVKKYTDDFMPQFNGLYEITFTGYTLDNHPQFTNSAGIDSVQWYRGSIRIAKETDPDGERKTLKVIRMDNIGTGELKVFALDESFSSDPLQAGLTRITSVNFYPGYRAYLYHNIPSRLTETDILPQIDGVFEKYSIFGLRSVDLQYIDYKSRISIPSMMFARKLEDPEVPQQPLGAKYATRPDYFGRSSYAFTTTYAHKPFSVTFLRTNDDILLSALYKKTDYGVDPELNSIQDIRNKNSDEFLNDRLLDLANVIVDSNTHLFKVYNNYNLPLPNNQDFFISINNFIDQHNTFYQDSISHRNLSDIASMDTIIIPADPAGRYGELKFFDFVKQTIQNTYVPLTEIPIIYQHIKAGAYQPIPKSQVIRDRNGVLLNPTSPEFDMAPMVKVLSINPHKTLFVDYTLDGASTSVYFYSVKETNVQMMQSELSQAIGPIQMVNSFPLRTPEIKSVIPVLENPDLSISPKMLVDINSYDKIHHIKKVKLYRALNIGQATSVRDMTLVNEVSLSDVNITQDAVWTIEDEFHDLLEVPFSDPLYYRVTVEREIQYAEPNYTGQPDILVTDYAPSEASKLMITTITENVLPKSPELSFIGNESPAEINNVVFKWDKRAYKAKYHLYKMSNQGNWIKIASLQTNDASLTLALANTDWGNGGVLPLVDNEGNAVFHHFKVLTENTSGMFSTDENILTIGNQFAFSIETTPQLARYKPYFSTEDLSKDHNLYLPPYSIYGNIYNNANGVVDNPEILDVWMRMPDEYIILPEILQDHLKNPLVYNIKTKKFGCYYSVTRMWDGHIQGSKANFLRNSVVRTRATGARECVVNLGSDAVFINNNIEKLKLAIASKNDRGMDKITLIVNGVFSHYTLEQIANF
jgi:hypothetical protein